MLVNICSLTKNTDYLFFINELGINVFEFVNPLIR